ncbi:MAG: sigma-70 family RNA polymerase sigma factor [Oligoflexia bacterium]|nr:sigma-70 family RNA polymerase sigma factor [Oligoflexia bacterium]
MYAETVSTEAHKSRRDALIEEYRNYVSAVVGHLISSMGLPRSCSDEFIAAGYLGLVEAAERFDFSSGYPFKNFAFLRIRGAIIDSIRECSELTGKAYRYARALKAAQEMREDDEALATLSASGFNVNSQVTLNAVMGYLGQSVVANRLNVVSFHGLLNAEPGVEASPEANFLRREDIEKMRILVRELPKRERTVVEEFYFKGRPFIEIGQKMGGYSKSWVSRVHSSALKALLEAYSKIQELQEKPCPKVSNSNGRTKKKSRA